MGNDQTDRPDCPKRGRPPRGTEALRHRALLQAAEDLFMEQGFGAASMEAVAKRAGISKKTIYSFFDTKEALFEAMMKAHIERSPLPTFETNIADAATLERTLVANLTEVARLRLVPFAVHAFRLTIAEATRFPEMARSFYREAPQRHVRMVAEWLKTQIEHGLLVLDDPYEAAIILTSALILEPLRTAALGVSDLPSLAATEARATLVVRLFLKGCLKQRGA